MNKTSKEIILNKWKADWENALKLWSKFTKLKNPLYILSPKEAKENGTENLFAMIRLNDHTVVLDLNFIDKKGLGDYSLEIMAHEVGHHIYCPANLADMGRMLIRIKKALKLTSLDYLSSFVGNIYTDLLINHKLKYEFGLRIDEVYKILNTDKPDEFWTFYMRIYEILWSLPKGELAKGKISSTLEADAGLGNRLVRNYSGDWLRGAGKFAALCVPYLLKDNNASITQNIFGPMMDSKGNGGSFNDIPDGLIDIEEGEERDILHPSLDPELNDSFDGEIDDLDGKDKSKKKSLTTSHSSGQTREPFEYGQILKDMGFNVSREDITYKYYKEKSLPYLIPFPQMEMPDSTEPLIEGTEVWDVSSPIENINWFQTAMRSPVIIPGYTILEDYFGTTSGENPEKEPIDLDIYVDCSGSMPDPRSRISYLALAGTIIALSALRTGAKVQATLWSGAKQFHTTNGFISDEKKLISIIAGYIGGATAFPIHILRDTYKDRKLTDRKVHILQISDDGITTMFNKDEKGNSGEKISEIAIEKSGGGATMVLNYYGNIKNDKKLALAKVQGWDIHIVKKWEDLVEFARIFSNKTYSGTKI
ncbi:MAG: VWA domain-containing protein [Leptospiraceae bacterium]|nr:VWA domain-containing protein [Leptospiraceae bacterium]